MRRRWMVIAWLALGGPASLRAQDGVAGRWVGEYAVHGERVYFELQLPEGTSPEAVMDLPLQRRRVPVAGLRRDAPTLAFTAGEGDGAVAFAGRMARGRASGRVTRGASIGRFDMLRLGAMDTAASHRLSGNYALAPGHLISIAQIVDVGNLPVLYDHRTRRMGLLLPLADSSYVAGPSLGVAFPPDIRITLLRAPGGRIRALRVQERGHPPRLARRLDDYREVEVEFGHDSIRLAGTMFLPRTPGRRHPAAVNVAGPGGGDGGRNLGETTPYLLSQGVAFLAYDKRGTGRSRGGHWTTAGVEGLADDAAAAVAYLRTRADVDAARVGLWATSNGAWVVPVAAERVPVAFAIVRSPPLLPIGENMAYEIENDLRAAGVAEAERKQALSLFRRFRAAVDADSGWAGLAAAVRRARGARWLEMSRVPDAAELEAGAPRPWLRDRQRVLRFDPLAAWRRFHAPVLAFFGGMDRSIPAARSRDLLAAALRDGGNHHATLRFLPEANHIMFETAPDDPYVGAHHDTSPLNARSAAGYHDEIARWLRAHGFAGAAPGTRP